MVPPPSRLRRSVCRPALTHGMLLIHCVGIVLLFHLAPWYVAYPLGVLLFHRAAILLHEYVHGIPFRKNKHNRLVLTAVDCLMLGYGTLEIFRALHLQHHRWLNTPRDPAWADTNVEHKSLGSAIAALELVHMVRQLLWSADSPVDRKRALVHMLVSVAWASLLVTTGFGQIVLRMLIVSWITALVSASLRGAVEHHGPPGEEGFAHEYRPIFPAFNINRHIHHHLKPGVPWYELEYLTERPLPSSAFFVHWYRAHIKGDYELMRPMDKTRRAQR